MVARTRFLEEESEEWRNDNAGPPGTILAWEREIGVPVLPLSAAEETAPQIRRLLGQAAAERHR